MTDGDTTSALLERVSDLEADLARIRGGRDSRPRIDLMNWTARQPANDTEPAGLYDALRRALREDWRGFSEFLTRWMTRVDERFSSR